MSTVTRGIAYGATAVLILALVGGAAAQAVGFDYSSLTPLALMIYAGAGFYVGTTGPVWKAALAGGAVGLIDATAGWAIAYALGPGRPQMGERITALGLFNTALFVTLLALAAGAVGGWLGARLGRRRGAAP